MRRRPWLRSRLTPARREGRWGTAGRALGAAVLASAVLAGCGSADRSSSPSAAVAQPGRPAPSISGRTIDGRSLDLAALHGRPVVVNFWASWCVPCRQEFPLLLAAERAHAAQGLAIVGVLYKDDPAPARAFAGSMHADWPTVVDPDGSIAAAYTVVAPPQTYFVDRAGVLRSRHIGELLEVDLDQALPAILGS